MSNAAVALILLASCTLLASTPASGSGIPEVVANDNRTPAGTLRDGMLALELRAAEGVWRPQGESQPALRIEAFGEATASLSVPAPLVRVPSGTEVSASIRNELARALRVHGLCERGAAACAPLEVPAGQVRHIRFKSGRPGTYHYWATTTGMPQQFRGAEDTQLSGAFIVDEAPGASDNDRVLVITEWSNLTTRELLEIAQQDDPGAAFLKRRPEVLFLINGRAWPHTERLQYALHDRVRWRVVNLSTQMHPMHLHGFYFSVESIGNGTSDTPTTADQRPQAVTQLMPPGSTLVMSWVPERTGNWLFHCHVMTHVSPSLYVDGTPRPHAGNRHEHHTAAGMTGMVLGVSITGAEEPSDVPLPQAASVRKLTLLMRSDASRFGDAPAYVFARADHDGSETGAAVPGPTLVLTRGEPIEITLVNQLPEATAIHWHGMELDSYYDGVHGYGGNSLRVTPMIEPGDSFVVRFTPPRTGTFMYHTHLHDRRQLTSGLYGAMLVVEPGETFDAASDHVVVLGRGGPASDAAVVINGERDLRLVWKAGTRHRIRVINITPDDTLAVTLQTNDGPVTWQPMTKDGAAVPNGLSRLGPAKQLIGVGETYDFMYDAPPGRRNLWLEVRSSGGRWHAQGMVIVR